MQEKPMLAVNIGHPLGFAMRDGVRYCQMFLREIPLVVRAIEKLRSHVRDHELEWSTADHVMAGMDECPDPEVMLCWVDEGGGRLRVSDHRGPRLYRLTEIDISEDERV